MKRSSHQRSNVLRKGRGALVFSHKKLGHQHACVHTYRGSLGSYPPIFLRREASRAVVVGRQVGAVQLSQGVAAHLDNRLFRVSGTYMAVSRTRLSSSKTLQFIPSRCVTSCFPPIKATLRRRIENDQVLGYWRFLMKYLEPYAKACQGWLRNAAKVIDTTGLAPKGRAADRGHGEGGLISDPLSRYRASFPRS